MFDNLDKADWASIRDAYGKASDIPSLLRALLSPPGTVRQRALEELDNRIHHQGTLYEAAVYVAPFLVELLEAPETPDKSDIVAIFVDLAEYKSPEDYSDEELQWEITLREVVESNIDLLYHYLEFGDSVVRCVIARALRVFPQHSAKSLPLLARALAIEQQPEIKEEIAGAIDVIRSGTMHNGS